MILRNCLSANLWLAKVDNPCLRNLCFLSSKPKMIMKWSLCSQACVAAWILQDTLLFLDELLISSLSLPSCCFWKWNWNPGCRFCSRCRFGYKDCLLKFLCADCCILIYNCCCEMMKSWSGVMGASSPCYSWWRWPIIPESVIHLWVCGWWAAGYHHHHLHLLYSITDIHA